MSSKEADPLRVFSNPDLELETPLVDQAIEQDTHLAYGSASMEVSSQDAEKAQIALRRALKKLFGDEYKKEYPYGAPRINRHYD